MEKSLTEIKCVKCGTKLRNEAIYCDQCGHYLKFDNSIQLMFNKNKEIQKFKKIIKFSVDSLEKDKNGICIEIRIEKYLELIIDYFCELTNINKILVNYDCSIHDIYKKLPFILVNLKKCSEDNILNEFIFQVHQYIKSCDNKYNFEKHFLFYTNIDKFKYSNDKNFKEILSFFNLSIFDSNKFIFKNEVNEKIKSKFYFSKCIILDCHVTGKNITLMENESLNRIYSFFGYLSFIHYFYKQSERWSSNEFDLKFNDVDLEILCSIILNNDFSFFDDEMSCLFIIEDLNKYDVSKCLNFNKISFDKTFYSTINKTILDDLNEFLKLYYLASYEKSIENSYVKFWSLNEKIIKKICGNQSDEKMLLYMVKILKFYHNKNNFFTERIKTIRRKRNNFIHENINNISQSDRNLIKLISDLLLSFIIQFSNNINSMHEYQIILDYFNRNDVERTIELINFSTNLKNNF